ncbi:hypothetical protein [Streptomyces goshikiensis]|uniref:hypothetical protein n=1 Tax=Streptomyces goshikiensis TaxID=1942 RepID=UPI0033A120D3
MSGEHLITDDETRRIAEGFLAASPWLGDVEWGRTVIGPGAGYLKGFGPDFPEDVELREGQRWSWKVSFTDPSGEGKCLGHESVLEGLTRIVYGDHPNPDGWRHMAIQQWFTEPSDSRQTLNLSAADQSQICQQALYGKTVFPTGEAEAMFGKKLDFFEKQRSDQAATDSPGD